MACIVEVKSAPRLFVVKVEIVPNLRMRYRRAGKVDPRRSSSKVFFPAFAVLRGTCAEVSIIAFPACAFVRGMNYDSCSAEHQAPTFVQST